VKKAVNDFLVIENRALNATNYLIRLLSPEPLPAIYPGQFVNVGINDSSEVFLRRPFSIFEVDYENNTLGLVVKILGKGSKKLSEAATGSSISLIYPLGKGFSQPARADKILLIGGGSGVAPILFLAKTANTPAENVNILIGAKSAGDHIGIEDYRQYGATHFTTEDGSLGVKGFVTQHPLFAEEITGFDKIYACGPDPMMRAVAKMAQEKGIFCEVSLENLMACGFGVCLCCIEPTVKGNLCVCTDGPVFNINSLKW